MFSFFKRGVDVAVAFPPMTVPKAPPSSLYALKTVAEDSGFRCEVRDLNIDLYKREGFKEIFRDQSGVFFGFDEAAWPRFCEFYDQKLEPIFVEWAKELVSLRPKLIGISLFTYFSVFSARKLVSEIRKLGYDRKILFGGFGLDTLVEQGIFRSYFGANCDYIRGDGEFAFLEYLKGNLHRPEINGGLNQINDLDSLPVTRYDRNVFKEFDEISNGNVTYLTGSRGCIRKCNFCDVNSFWPKYRRRSAESIYQEMLYLNREHKRNVFSFTDSLINGDLKILRQLCRLLIEHREKFPDEALYFNGQFICRSKRDFSADDYDLLKAAGCCHVSIGIESGSERLRTVMRKNFSNEDLFYTLRQLQRVKIPSLFLMIVGYPFETETDFQETLQFLRQCQAEGFFSSDDEGFSLVGSIYWSAMAMPTNTPIFHEMYEKFPDEMHGQKRHWNFRDNDRKLRLERMFRAINQIQLLGATHVIENQLAGGYMESWKEYIELTKDQPESRIHLSDVSELFHNSFGMPKVNELI